MLNLKDIDNSWTLFLDRDGVLNVEKKDHYVLNPSEFIFLERVHEALKILSEIFGLILVASNQRGVAKQLMTLEDLQNVHAYMMQEIVEQKGRIDKIYFCTDLDNSSPTRKPNPGMALQANGKNGLVVTLANDQPTSYPYKLRYSAEDTLRMRQPAKIQGKIVTPWRVVIIGKDLNALVNNDIITNLNPPSDPKLFPNGIHTDWIKPGRAVWKYLNGGGDGTPEAMKHFTDAAAQLGFEHNILEGFWTKWTGQQLKGLVDYSKQKGVGIWLWKHSKSLRTSSARDSFFSKCHALGITGAKVDFFDSEAKEVIDLYDSILHDAAHYHILLDFHGANKPTGLMRTYPNSLTYEAVKGMESSKLADRATHETTIPFTRCLAGPAEYTVMLFNERRKNTTWAHQIASAAILNAPLLTYAANPDTILMNPAVNIIKSIPATWDETIVLPPSEIGKLAVYARRKGGVWFVAVMNGVEPKKIKIPLSFLKGNYKAEVARDGAINDASVIVEQKNYSSGDILELNLISGGGFIAKFSK